MARLTSLTASTFAPIEIDAHSVSTPHPHMESPSTNTAGVKAAAGGAPAAIDTGDQQYPGHEVYYSGYNQVYFVNDLALYLESEACFAVLLLLLIALSVYKTPRDRLWKVRECACVCVCVCVCVCGCVSVCARAQARAW